MTQRSYKKGISGTYHAQRTYENTLFPKKKTPRSILLLGVLVFLGLMGWGMLRILHAPFFSIEAIRIYGLETLDSATLEAELYEQLQSDQLFGISRLHILRRQNAVLREALPVELFSSISIQRSGRIIDIFVTEQAQGSLVHAGGSWSLYNLEGEFIRTLTEDEVRFVSSRINGESIDAYLFYKDTPIVELANQNWSIDSITNPLIAVQAMHNALLRSGNGVSYHIIRDPQFFWAEAVMTNGYRLYYDLGREAAVQTEQLMTVLREIDSAQPFQRIDVRFNGRVFVE